MFWVFWSVLNSSFPCDCVTVFWIPLVTVLLYVTLNLHLELLALRGEGRRGGFQVFEFAEPGPILSTFKCFSLSLWNLARLSMLLVVICSKVSILSVFSILSFCLWVGSRYFVCVFKIFFQGKVFLFCGFLQQHLCLKVKLFTKHCWFRSGTVTLFAWSALEVFSQEIGPEN